MQELHIVALALGVLAVLLSITMEMILPRTYPVRYIAGSFIVGSAVLIYLSG
jgi:hypothetical protein